MPIRAKYQHTSIVAHNWRAVARFYQDVFGCQPIPPERNYAGAWVRDVTDVPDVSLCGMHLRLPGYGDNGPTLEIFQYSRVEDGLAPAANRRGFTHIAFHVEDVSAARSAVLEAGGRDLGKLHTMEVPDVGVITLIYMTDPEGNIIELQNWSGSST